MFNLVEAMEADIAEFNKRLKQRPTLVALPQFDWQMSQFDQRWGTVSPSAHTCAYCGTGFVVGGVSCGCGANRSDQRRS